MRPFAIDLSCLEVAPETGVERYARRLVESLQVVAPDHPFFVFVRPGRPAPPMRAPSRVVMVDSLLPRVAWRETALQGALVREGAALLHSPVAAVPFRPPVPTIATIHDVSREGVGRRGFLSRNSLRLLHAVRSARALIVPSEATKSALLRLDPRLASRVTVIPHGVDADFCPVGLPLERARYGIPPGPYVLDVGTIRPRKDPLTLVRAFADALGRTQRDDLSLVLAGHLRMSPDELRRPLAERGLAHRLILPGYVARQDLPDLYREAELAVVPSKLEGFGLCALESMACGTPLIVSRDDALLELVQGAALPFPAGDVEALTDALVAFLENPSLRLNKRGVALERAREFSWEASARAHVAVYEEVAARRAR